MYEDNRTRIDGGVYKDGQILDVISRKDKKGNKVYSIVDRHTDKVLKKGSRADVYRYGNQYALKQKLMKKHKHKIPKRNKYSIAEKIQYYAKRIKSKRVTKGQKRYAQRRLKQLKER